MVCDVRIERNEEKVGNRMEIERTQRSANHSDRQRARLPKESQREVDRKVHVYKRRRRIVGNGEQTETERQWHLNGWREFVLVVQVECTRVEQRTPLGGEYLGHDAADGEHVHRVQQG